MYNEVRSAARKGNCSIVLQLTTSFRWMHVQRIRYSAVASRTLQSESRQVPREAADSMLPCWTRLPFLCDCPVCTLKTALA